MLFCKKKFFFSATFIFLNFFLLKSQDLLKNYLPKKKLQSQETQTKDFSTLSQKKNPKTFPANFLKNNKNLNRFSAFKKKSKKKRKKKSKKKKSFFSKNPKIKSEFLKKVFGSDEIKFKPTGRLSLDMGLMDQKLNYFNTSTKKKNSSLSFEMNPHIQMGITGKLGTKLKMNFKFNKENPLSFEENFSLKLEGEKNDKIKKIELGKLHFSSKNALIGFSENLFGIKSNFQFGNTLVESIAGSKKTKTKIIDYNEKESLQNFEKSPLDYAENQHYFLAHYFRNNYNKSLKNYEGFTPKILIEKIELWKLDSHLKNENKRNLLALRELGENNESLNFPSNSINSLYDFLAKEHLNNSYEISNFLENKIIEGISYKNEEHFLSLRNASLLEEGVDYKIQKNLGYLSLRNPLREDQALAVAFSFKDLQSGKSYQVGDFSHSKSSSLALLVKLLKTKNTSTTSPLWKLMMKNIYHLGNSLKEEGFDLNIFYNEATKGYLPFVENKGKKTSLFSLFQFDKINENDEFQEQSPYFQPQAEIGDGKFDYLEGITIDSEFGNLIFTTLEPFAKMEGLNDEKYEFKELYLQKKRNLVEKFDKKNLYQIKGHYLGKSFLGNIEPSSTKVFIEGKLLKKGIDYIIKKNNEIEILNPLFKNKSYSLSYENKGDYFSTASKVLGLNITHNLSENFQIGATALNISQSTKDKKIFYGAEITQNKALGLQLNYKKDLPFLDRYLSKIKGESPSTPSTIKAKIEGAYLKTKNHENSKIYLDDFSKETTSISLHSQIDSWSLASFPKNENPDFLFEENFSTNRGLLSWYQISSLFYSQGYKFKFKEELSKNVSRKINYNEIFPDLKSNSDQSISEFSRELQTFDLSFFPNEKGPYNTSKDRSESWAGIMKALSVNDFISSNIEYLEFWLMDPFSDTSNDLKNEGELIFHLGTLSEDILKDNFLSYENGLPTNQNKKETIKTKWGKIPKEDPENYIFESESLKDQDLGLDGLSDKEEQEFYKENKDFINPITHVIDPAGDNYVAIFDPRWESSPENKSIINRYKYYRNPQGNSSSSFTNSEIFAVDKEDLDEDLNLNTQESYYQYKLKISHNKLELPGLKNYLVEEKISDSGLLPNGKINKTKWYKVRVPLSQGKAFGQIKDLSYIKHIRILLKGFSKTTTLRFASLELKGNKWKKYEENLDEAKNYNKELTHSKTSLLLDTISEGQLLEGHSPYLSPDSQSNEDLGINTEASLLLKIENLGGDSTQNKKEVSVFREFKADFRPYKKIEFSIHAENLENPNEDSLDKDLFAYLRLGSDQNNYYQYEIPIKYSSKEAFSKEKIWPKENVLSLDLEELIKAKLKRNKLALDQKEVVEYSLATIGKILLKGRPSLGQISYLMIGIKNKSATKAKNLLLWLDNLELIGLENKKSYATKAEVDFYLGDVMQIQLSGKYLQRGFQGIYENKSETFLNTLKNYNLNTKLSIDQFFPKKWKLKIPFYYEKSEDLIFPYYESQESDLKLTKKNAKNQKEKNIDYIKNSTYYLSLSKDKTNEKNKFWKLENFSYQISYQKEQLKNFYYIHFLEKKLQSTLHYNYDFDSKFYSPFDKWKLLKKENKWASWLKSFQVRFYPKRIWLNSQIDRFYHQYAYKTYQSSENLKLLSKVDFGFNWNAGIHLEPFPALDINFVLEAKNKLKTKISPKNLIWTHLLKRGNPTNYTHQLSIYYPIPMSKIPYLNFINKSLFSYKTSYLWEKNKLKQKGNFIANSQDKSWELEFDFEKIYTQFRPYLKIKEKIKNQNLKLKKWLSSKKKRRFPRFSKKLKLSTKEHFLLALMALKKFEFSYLNSSQIKLKGFLGSSIFHNVFNENLNSWSPWHLNFSLGSQKNIKELISKENNLVSINYLSDFYHQNNQKSYEFKIEASPIKDLQIKLNSYKKIHRNRFQLNFLTTKNETYTTQMSFISFVNEKKFYKKFKNNLNSKDFKNKNSIEAKVLVNDFFSSSNHQDFKKSNFDELKIFPLPNWEITYHGLSKIKKLIRYIKNFTLTHNYQCLYNFREMGMDSMYKKIEFHRGFQPLLGVEIKLRNQIEFAAKYQIYERFSLHFANHSIYQISQRNWIAAMGYTLKKLSFKFRFRNKKRKLKGDLNFKLRFGIHHEIQKTYKILEEKFYSNTKEKTYSLAGSLTYFFNKNFKVKAFAQYLKRSQNAFFPEPRKFQTGLQFFFSFGP